MTNAWDRTRELADKHAQQGGIFIRLQNHGDKVVGVFCGEPHPREVVWLGDRYEVFEPDNPEHRGKRASLKVMLNFYVPTEGAMKVIEGGARWFTDVVKVRDKYGLDKWLFEVERSGDSGNPKTTYSILPERQIDAEIREQIETQGLHDLAALAAGKKDSGEGGGRGGGGTPPSGAPATAAPPAAAVPTLDSGTSGELVTKLRQLPRSEVDAFLGKFGVRRVRDIPASQAAAAVAFVAELIRRHAAPPPPSTSAASAQAEVDPFA